MSKIKTHNSKLPPATLALARRAGKTQNRSKTRRGSPRGCPDGNRRGLKRGQSPNSNPSFNLKAYIKGRSAVFIDAANLFYASKTLKFKIDFERLMRFFQRYFNPRQVSYYTGYDPDNTEQLRFLARLESFGYQLIRKPIKKIRINKRQIVSKANLDVELSVDALETAHTYQSIVLVSGDSDFAYLVKRLKDKAKRVIVISARGHISKELIQLADKYVPFEKIESEIKLIKNHPDTKAGGSYLEFNDNKTDRKSQN